jgi:predicted nucleotidyltransferase
MHSNTDFLNFQERKTLQALPQKLQDEMVGQVLSVYLFGSRARGDAHPDSDLDLAVIVNPADLKTRTKIRDLAVEVWLENGLYISTRALNQELWERLKELKTGLYRNIQRDGIDLLSAFV